MIEPMTPTTAAKEIRDLLSRSGLLQSMESVDMSVLEVFLKTINSPSTSRLLAILNIDKYTLASGEDQLIEWLYQKYTSRDINVFLEILRNLSGNKAGELIVSSVINKIIAAIINPKRRNILLPSARCVVCEVEMKESEEIAIVDIIGEKCELIDKMKYGNMWRVSAIVKNSEDTPVLIVEVRIKGYDLLPWKIKLPLMKYTGDRIMFDVKTKKLEVSGNVYEIRVDLYNNTATPIREVVISINAPGNMHPSKMIIVREVSAREHFSKSVIYMPPYLPVDVNVTMHYIMSGEENVVRKNVRLKQEDVGVLDVIVYHSEGMVQIYSLSNNGERETLIGGLLSAANAILKEVMGGQGMIEEINLPDGYLHIKNGKYVVVALLSRRKSPVIDIALRHLADDLDSLEEIRSFRGKIYHIEKIREKVLGILSKYILVPVPKCL